MVAATTAATALPATAAPLDAARPLRDRVALVTGAARGIGRACAAELARRGAHVVLFDILAPVEGYRAPPSTAADMAETVRLVRAAGAEAVPVRGDTRSQADLDRAVRTAVRRFGRLDMLVNNAGVAAEATVGQMTERQWQTVIDVNLTGYFHGIKAVLPEMVRRRRGAIVSIASVAGRFGAVGNANYGAAKWGVIGLTKAVALENGPDNVRANAVVPTFVDTPQITSDRVLREVFFPDDPNPTVADLDALARTEHALPVGILPPAEIARSVAFLLGDEARYITGTALDVAAGWNATWSA